MPQYECAGCGTMTRAHGESDGFTMECPVCEELTRWTTAFEADSGVGVYEP